MGGRGTEQDPLVAESRQLVRWRQDGARRRGIACRVTCCPNPDCDCRELHIDAFEVDDRFEEITVRGEEIMVLHRVEPGGPPPPAGHALALLNLETGRLQDAEADPARAEEPGLIEELREMVDADTLEELRADYRRFKDRARERAAAVSQDATWRERDWTVWDGEQPVAWMEVADAPLDTYELEGGSFEAVDLYCIRPGCECEDVEVHFCWAGDDEDPPVVGAVYVDGPSGEVVGTSNEAGERPRLEALWAAYAERHNTAELTRRWWQVQHIGPELHALRREQLRAKTVRRRPRVGRNDPCPCGSGKKYKKCCLART
jgi:hypothetical protein